MAAQRRRAANFDRGHHTPLAEAQTSFVGSTPSAWRWKTSATSSFGWDTAGASIRRCPRHAQEFERAPNLPDQVDRNPRIAHGRLDVPMPEQVLDHANVARRWVAKLCRNVWTVTDLLSPAASAARRHASCSVRFVIGRDGLRPGNSQCDGRVRCQ
jgi:hypothetical protein